MPLNERQEKQGAPLCQACRVPMGKAGLAWSGKRKVQRWRCSKCGARTIKRDNNRG